MENVLITGITGFLGRHLTKHILADTNSNIFGISHSEHKILAFRDKFPTDRIKLYRGDIVNSDLLERIISENNITRIIHCAAMKNMWICQNNPTSCIETNIIGTMNLVRLAKKYGVRDLIAVSTDKANNPSCIYGMSKHLMEAAVLENGFRIFQGVNFMWSDGSVLEFWYKKYRDGEELSLNSNVVRYFCDINEVCREILTSREKIIFVDNNYKISIRDLLEGFCKCFNYSRIVVDEKNFSYEKMEEEIRSTSVVAPSVDEIATLLRSTLSNTIFF
jgi:UDP-N-acetylglucosamine 4,6-dehydratase/5-epimerase